MTASTASCLILGDADFEEPTRSAPELIPVTATTEFITFVNPEGDDPLTFSAVLRSEDAGDDLQAGLLIDYGIPTPRGQPWQEDVDENVILPSPAGTEALRDVNLDWFATLPADATSECRRVTMVVSHNFARIAPYSWCPTDPSDVARLTWFVALCRTLSDCSFDDCATEPPGGFVYCPEDVLSALAEDGP